MYIKIEVEKIEHDELLFPNYHMFFQFLNTPIQIWHNQLLATTKQFVFINLHEHNSIFF